jgi:hypothetical protein
MNRLDKGVLVKELASSDPYSKTHWMIIYIDLLVVPLIFTLVLFITYETFASLGLIVPVAIILYTLPVLASLAMQHIFGRYLLPAYVFSEGIQLPVSWLSRIAHLPTFVGKDEIAEISIQGLSGKDEKGTSTHRAHFSLKTKAGKHYFVGYRDPQEMLVASDYIAKEWRTKIVIEKDAANKLSPTGPGEASGPNDPMHMAQSPANDGLLSRYCIHCGKATEDYYAFCPFCGNRTE